MLAAYIETQADSIAHLSNTIDISSSKSILKKFICCKTQSDVDTAMRRLHFGGGNSEYIVQYTARHVPLPELGAHCIEVAMKRLKPVSKSSDGTYSKTAVFQMLSTISAFVNECIHNNRVYSNISTDHIMRDRDGTLYFVSPDDEFSTSGSSFLPTSLCHTTLICAVYDLRRRQLPLTHATVETMAISALQCMFELLVPLWAKHRHENMIQFETLVETTKQMQMGEWGVLKLFQYTSRILMNTLHLVPDAYNNSSSSNPDATGEVVRAKE